MRRAFSFRLVPALAVLVCLLTGEAAAQPPDIVRTYRIVPSQSTIIQTGGIASRYLEFDVRGGFDLEVGYVPDIRCDRCLVPFAQFSDVDAWMIPRSPLTYVLNLDDVLNLSGLEGTWDVPNYLHFTGLEGQGQPIRLDAVLHNRSLRLIGASNPGCCDMFQYTVDLYARQVPFADFNADSVVDAADFTLWRQTFGQTVVAGEGADANADGVINAADYTVWRDAYDSLAAGAGAAASAAAVPEPHTLVLVLAGVALLLAGGRRGK